MADGRVIIEVAVDANGVARGASVAATGLRTVDTAADKAKAGLTGAGTAAKKTGDALVDTGERGSAGVKRLDDGLKGLVKKFAVAATAVVALRAGFRFLSEAVSLSGIQQIAEGKLDQALANIGDTSAGAATRLRDLAKATQQVSNFGDEAIITAQAMLLSFAKVGGADGAAMLTPALVDMAAGMSKVTGETVDLNQVAITLGKVITNGAGAFSEYGISLTDTQLATFDASEGLDRIALTAEIVGDNFGGMAAATVTSSKQMGIAVTNLKEEIGRGLKAEVDALFTSMIKLARDETFIAAVQGIGRAIASAAGEVVALIQAAASLGRGLDTLTRNMDGAFSSRVTGFVRTIAGLTAGMITGQTQASAWTRTLTAAARGVAAINLRRATDQVRGLTEQMAELRSQERRARAAGDLDATTRAIERQGEVTDQLRASLVRASAAQRELSELRNVAVAGQVKTEDDGRPKRDGGGLGGIVEPDTPRVVADSAREAGNLSAALSRASRAGRDVETAVDQIKARLAAVTGELGDLQGVDIAELVNLEAARQDAEQQLDAIRETVRLGVMRLRGELSPEKLKNVQGRGPMLPPIDLSDFDASLARANEGMARLREQMQAEAEKSAAVAEYFGGVIAGGLEQGLSDLGMALGEFAAGAGTFGDIGATILGSIGDLAVRLGQAMIQFGMAGIALKQLIKSPPLAVAAGVALVALGRGLTSYAGSLLSTAGGGGGGGAQATQPTAAATTNTQAGVTVGRGALRAVNQQQTTNVNVTQGAVTADVIDIRTDLETVRMRLRRMDARVNNLTGGRR